MFLSRGVEMYPPPPCGSASSCKPDISSLRVLKQLDTPAPPFLEPKFPGICRRGGETTLSPSQKATDGVLECVTSSCLHSWRATVILKCGTRFFCSYLKIQKLGSLSVNPSITKCNIFVFLSKIWPNMFQLCVHCHVWQSQHSAPHSLKVVLQLIFECIKRPLSPVSCWDGGRAGGLPNKHVHVMRPDVRQSVTGRGRISLNRVFVLFNPDTTDLSCDWSPMTNASTCLGSFGCTLA